MAGIARKKKRLDMNELAHRVVQQATEDADDASVDDEPDGSGPDDNQAPAPGQ